jgi:hypothetical protein
MGVMSFLIFGSAMSSIACTGAVTDFYGILVQSDRTRID